LRSFLDNGETLDLATVEGVEGWDGGFCGDAVGLEAVAGFGGFRVEEEGNEVGEAAFPGDGEIGAGDAGAFGAGEGFHEGVWIPGGSCSLQVHA
jgi:hypothetical protein